MHSPICWTLLSVIFAFSLVILTWFWVFIFYTSRFLFRLSAGSGEHRSGGNRANSEWSVQMSTRGIDDFQYTKKYCVWIKKKPSIATWLSRWDFIFRWYFFTLTSARAMLHWTRTKGKNRVIRCYSYTYAYSWNTQFAHLISQCTSLSKRSRSGSSCLLMGSKSFLPKRSVK